MAEIIGNHYISMESIPNHAKITNIQVKNEFLISSDFQ
jgi:hypothetical protein